MLLLCYMPWQHLTESYQFEYNKTALYAEEHAMKLLIIDGQSGRLGAQIIEGLIKAGLPEGHTIVAVGTNALATSGMINAGAHQGATGENAVAVQCRSADLIIGPIGIVLADAMLGEITPRMAEAVGQSSAMRILIPSSRCSTYVVGVAAQSRRQQIDDAVMKALACLENPEQFQH